MQNKPLAILEIRILEYLDLGHRKALPLKALCLCLNTKNERQVREAIESLRRQGWPILIPQTAPFGYFLPETCEELEAYIRYMRSRLIEEYRTYKAVKKSTIMRFEKVAGQLPLMLR